MPDIGIIGGELLERRLAELAGRLEAHEELRVGFLEGATYPDGTSVALVAAVNEFGAPSRGQPPRPFFRNMIAAKKSEWGPAIAALLKNSDYDVHATLDRAGMGIEGQLRQSIVDLTEPPLAESTIREKSRGGTGNLHGAMGPAKPLVDTGHMLNSIDHEVREAG